MYLWWRCWCNVNVFLDDGVVTYYSWIFPNIRRTYSREAMLKRFPESYRRTQHCRHESTEDIHIGHEHTISVDVADEALKLNNLPKSRFDNQATSVL